MPKNGTSALPGAEGRVSTVDPGNNPTWSFTYNALGHRVQWASSSGGELHLFDPAGNWLGNANSYTLVRLGERPLALYEGSQTYFNHVNALGSTSMFTNQGGGPQEDMLFYPWGDVWQSWGNGGYNFAYLPYRDLSTTTDITTAPFISPNFGRWFSPDPLGVKAVTLDDPQTWNMYAYVRNNPTTLTDPTGLGPDDPLYCGDSAPCAGLNRTPCAMSFDKCSGEGQPAAQNNVDTEQVGKTTVGSLEKTMSNEDRSLSGGAPGELEKGKTALANAIINNAELDQPAKVAKATGTATAQDAQIMRDAYTNRANGGADPVQGRSQFGTSHRANLHSRPAGNGLKGSAGRETVYEKFGPFKDSISRQPTYIYIYNDPGQ